MTKTNTILITATVSAISLIVVPLVTTYTTRYMYDPFFEVITDTVVKRIWHELVPTLAISSAVLTFWGWLISTISGGAGRRAACYSLAICLIIDLMLLFVAYQNSVNYLSTHLG